MPESKRRKKKSTYTPPPPPKPKETPHWWVPTSVVFLVVGLLWVVVTYIINAAGPIPGIGQWNLAVGFTVLLAGFLMMLRWR